MKLKLAVVAIGMCTAMSSGMVLAKGTTSLEKQVTQLEAQLKAMKSAKANTAIVSGEAGATLSRYSDVANTGYIDVDTDYSVIFETLPTMDFDLGLLKARKEFKSTPVIIGGSLEANVQYWRGDDFTTDEVRFRPIDPNKQTVNYNQGSRLFTSTAKIDTLANINDWTLLFGSFGADFNDTTTASGNGSAHFEVDQAFLTLGNLDKFPFFATIGKTRIAVGPYAGGGAWTAPLSQVTFRPGKVAQVYLGYYHDGLSSGFTFYNGDRNGHNPLNVAYYAGYNGSADQLNYNVSAGYMSNVAGTDNGLSGGLVASGKTTTGFDSRVAAYNISAGLDYYQFSLLGDYSQTMTDEVITMNNKARSWSSTLVYNPILAGKTTQFSITYSHNYNTENLYTPLSGEGMPGMFIKGTKKQIVANVSREVFKNVNMSVEYSWLKTFNDKHTSAWTFDTIAYF